MKKMKLVVTGGSGKLAKYLAPALAREHAILLYDKQRPQQSQFQWVQGEVTDSAKLSEVIRDADAVIHLAALRSRYNHLPIKVMETNTLGTFCVLEAARREGVKKLLLSSSDAVLGIAQSVTEFAPEYVPIDEKHPLKPQRIPTESAKCSERRCVAAMQQVMTLTSLSCDFPIFSVLGTSKSIWKKQKIHQRGVSRCGPGCT